MRLRVNALYRYLCKLDTALIGLDGESINMQMNLASCDVAVECRLADTERRRACR